MTTMIQNQAPNPFGELPTSSPSQSSIGKPKSGLSILLLAAAALIVMLMAGFAGLYLAKVAKAPSAAPKIKTSTPRPQAPDGCYWNKDIQCFAAPCNPVLVCDTPQPQTVDSL
jgi:hypothetical protein